MKRGIGIDLGTFHTVATSVKNNNDFLVPKNSIPSIALIFLNTIYVGNKARDQLDLSDDMELILTPKLLLHDDSKKDILRTIIRKLADQALDDIDYSNNQAANIVITVPPDWTMEQCLLVEEAVDEINVKTSFIHEPIALLIATRYLAYKANSKILAKLENTELFLVCDWGAGTVDIALVIVVKYGVRYEFSCIGDFTDRDHGGSSIARDIIRQYDNSLDIKEVNKNAYYLQLSWQGDKLEDFSHYQAITSTRRDTAANIVSDKINNLFKKNGITAKTSISCILHGGPLESEELRSILKDKLINKLNLTDRQFIHIGNKFTESLSFDKLPWRRDVLVSVGASLFASRGKVLPEFKYEIALKNSSGEICSKVPLEIRQNLSGIQVIRPPYTNCDYYVEVQQVQRDRSMTAQKKELGLYVRPNAVLRYQICEAGVGFACIEVSEVEDLPVPLDFIDSRSERVRLPECSTIFSITF